MSNPTPTVLYNPYVRIPFGVLFPHNSEHAVEARRKKKALSSSTPPQHQQQLGQKRSRDEDDVHTTTTDDSGSSRSTIKISSETKIDDVLRERTRQGVAMGITRALDLRKEEADLKHLSTTGGGGGNSSSITRIANQVAMLQSSDIGVNRETGEAMLGGGVQAPPPKPSSLLPPSFNESTAASTASSTTQQLPPKILESHLEFQRGKDGKHIIATAAPGRSASAVTVPHGKPSSTLIIRNLVLRDVFYGRRPSPTNNRQSTTTATTVDVATQARTAAAYKEKIIAEVSAECRNCGHVRDIVVCDMYQQCTSSSSPPSSSSTTSTNTNTAFPYPTMPMLAPSSPPPQNSIGPPLDSCSSLNSQRDAIVVWVRMDTVMNGFKAAQRLNGGKVFLGDPSRLVVAGFYPSPTFDAGIRTTNNDVLNSTNANVGGSVASPTSSSSSSPPCFNVAATTSSTNQQVVVVESLEKLLPAQYLNR